ncbi:MAG: 5-formyltetrahydrofolate cyclo-ligase [Alphaproteobacteria bacterium]|nr:5-formyltetrahydrofolate cyclo-ligase [Alphaproteobacteria bacterium]
MTQNTGSRASKKELRQRMLDARAGLAHELGDTTNALWPRLEPFIAETGPGVVAGYWPVRHEVSPLGLVEELVAKGWDGALPCVGSKNQPLIFREFRPGDALEPQAFGIPEPGPHMRVLVPDLLLVPLLAFDRMGGRLGYGAGLYDRTIEVLRAEKPGFLCLGLAYAGQEVQDLPAETHDEPLDAILTERETILPPDSGAGS